MIDREKVVRLRHGEERAFREIYDTHFSKLYRYAHSFTHSPEASEEIIQEVFATLWRKKQTLNPDHSLNHYLYTLTKHRCFRFLKQRAQQHALRQELIHRSVPSSNDTEDQVTYRQSYAIAQEAIRQLPPKRQLIYEMARLEGRPLQEIAEELGISLSTVKNQLLTASQAVRGYFRSRTDHLTGWLLMLSPFLL